MCEGIEEVSKFSIREGSRKIEWRLGWCEVLRMGNDDIKICIWEIPKDLKKSEAKANPILRKANPIFRYSGSFLERNVFHSRFEKKHNSYPTHFIRIYIEIRIMIM